MSATYAAAIAHDGAKVFALVVAVRTSTGAKHVLEAGLSTISVANKAEALAALAKAGHLITSNQYGSGHLSHAQADALGLL